MHSVRKVRLIIEETNYKTRFEKLLQALFNYLLLQNQLSYNSLIVYDDLGEVAAIAPR